MKLSKLKMDIERQKLDLSLQELAEHLSFSHAMLINYREGNNPIPWEKLKELARVLKTTVWNIAEFEEDERIELGMSLGVEAKKKIQALEKELEKKMGVIEYLQQEIERLRVKGGKNYESYGT
jgi:predicted RNase H-like nuclease (RuvC/YqgF family)